MNLTFDFISKMYNNRNSYAEIFTEEEIEAIHIPSKIENIIKEQIKKKKFILLTGNPGDGKTHLLRILKDFLIEQNAFVELDINEVLDHKAFLSNLKEAILVGRPAIIAINEYPLYELLKNMDESFPLKSDIQQVKKETILYGSECEDNSTHKVIIIDLNTRNLLNPLTLKEGFTKILSNNLQCDTCNNGDFCIHSSNLNALRENEIQDRIVQLTSLLGNIGNHAVMRDILGLVAFTLTGGQKCHTLSEPYYDLLFMGENTLFSEMKFLDPVKFSHPIIDEKLWNGLILDGWYLEPPIQSPHQIEDPEESMEVFASIKRKYFFEHEKGMELFSLYPNQLITFLNLLKEAGDEEVEVLQKIILSLNRFYNPKEHEDQKLFIWNNHSYESKKYPETIISNRSMPYQNMHILIPRLPSHLTALDYTPDHFILRVDYGSKKEEYADLKINFDLYKMLMLMASGYPPQILPNNHKFTIERFMYRLSAKTSKVQTNEFTIRSVKNNEIRKIIIKDGKYLMKRR